MDMKVTATSHAQTGNYQSLKKAHLEHDEEKYNSNKDIRYDKKHLNTHHVHVEDFEAFYEEKYEGPIKEFNLKQTRKDRKIDDYDTYLEKKKNNKNRNQKRPHDPNRLFLMSFSNMEDNDKIKNGLMGQLNLSEDEYLALMASAMDLSVQKFNNKYGHCMTITEHFTHVNEASPHAHCNLYAHGTDKFGKPYTDINDSLKELYAGTKERDGKTVRKNLKDYWKDFREEVDTMIIDSVKEKANEKLREKDIKMNFELDLYRKDSDYVGMAGDVYKEVHREADKQLEKKGQSLEEREQGLKDREQSLDDRESALNDRESALDEREKVSKDWEEELRKKHYEQVERDDELLKKSAVIDDFQERYNRLLEKEKAHDEYVVEIDAHMKNDAKVGANLREAGRTDSKFKESYRKMLKTQTNKNLDFKAKDDGPVK